MAGVAWGPKDYGMRKIISAMALLCAFAPSTEARTEHHHRSHAGRPAAWCGWYMRSQVGSDPGPEYDLARAWAHYGVNASGPTVGVIVVWRHHVGKIVAFDGNGNPVVKSGNDGHRVRTRVRSVSNAIAFRSLQ